MGYGTCVFLSFLYQALSLVCLRQHLAGLGEGAEMSNISKPVRQTASWNPADAPFCRVNLVLIFTQVAAFLN